MISIIYLYIEADFEYIAILTFWKITACIVYSAYLDHNLCAQNLTFNLVASIYGYVDAMALYS